MITRAQYLLSLCEENPEEVDDPDWFNFRKNMTPKEQHQMDRTSGATTNGRFKNYSFATKKVKRFDDPDPEDLEPGKDLDLDDDGEEDVEGQEEPMATDVRNKTKDKKRMQGESIKRYIDRVKRQDEFLDSATMSSLGVLGPVALPVGTLAGGYLAHKRAKKARELKIRQGGAGAEYDKAKQDLSKARKKQLLTLGMKGGQEAQAAKLAKQAALNKGLHSQAKLFSKTPPHGHGEVHIA